MAVPSPYKRTLLVAGMAASSIFGLKTNDAHSSIALEPIWHCIPLLCYKHHDWTLKMLLNYLYDHFLEEHDFANACDLSLSDLRRLIDKRVFPAPSYVYTSSGQSASFVSDALDEMTYAFHLKGYIRWVEAIKRFGLDTEAQARQYFFERYNAARAAFVSSDLGKDLTTTAPDLMEQFGVDHADATWGHFLSGVYGVCTRDGLPESVFLKQSGVMFIEAMITSGRGALTHDDLSLLSRAVAHLDIVESEFAPHEVQVSSRQRCIIDVHENFLSGITA